MRTTLLRTLAGVDGRWIIVGAFGFYLAAETLLRVVWQIDLWSLMGVWPAATLFLDARNITSAAECVRLGYDPLVANPCDPYGRPMNYPRVWLVPYVMGMNQSWTFTFGSAMVVSFILAFVLLAGPIPAETGVVMALAICSPAVMLGVERGQSDLLIFALLAFAVILWRRDDGGARTASPLLILFAAVLKIFPAAGLGAYLFAHHTRAAWMAVASFLAILLYLIVTRDDLWALSHSLPQVRMHSYGGKIIFAGILDRFAPGLSVDGLGVELAAVAALGILAVAAFWICRRYFRSPRAGDSGPIGWRLHSFNLGALIYLATFALINSWDYRLVFLLLTLPQLLQWSADANVPERSWARGGVATVLVSLYLGPLLADRSLADELVNWFLAWLLLVFLARSVVNPGVVAARGPHRAPAGTPPMSSGDGATPSAPGALSR